MESNRLLFNDNGESIPHYSDENNVKVEDKFLVDYINGYVNEAELDTLNISLNSNSLRKLYLTYKIKDGIKYTTGLLIMLGTTLSEEGLLNKSIVLIFINRYSIIYHSDSAGLPLLGDSKKVEVYSRYCESPENSWTLWEPMKPNVGLNIDGNILTLTGGTVSSSVELPIVKVDLDPINKELDNLKKAISKIEEELNTDINPRIVSLENYLPITFQKFIPSIATVIQSSWGKENNIVYDIKNNRFAVEALNFGVPTGLYYATSFTFSGARIGLIALFKPISSDTAKLVFVVMPNGLAELNKTNINSI